MSFFPQTDSAKAEESKVTACAAAERASVIGANLIPGLQLLLDDQTLFSHVSPAVVGLVCDVFAAAPGPWHDCVPDAERPSPEGYPTRGRPSRCLEAIMGTHGL